MRITINKSIIIIHQIEPIDKSKQLLDQTLDETKRNIEKNTDEARRQIPSNTQTVSELQEQAIQTSKDIANHYLEYQREVINSLQSIFAPYVENTNNNLLNNQRTVWKNSRNIF